MNVRGGFIFLRLGKVALIWRYIAPLGDVEWLRAHVQTTPGRAGPGHAVYGGRELFLSIRDGGAEEDNG